MTAVGFACLGAMGSRLAGRLLDEGHEVHGTKRLGDESSLAQAVR